MSFSACPIATIRAPIDKVWDLLADPAQYAAWWDLRTVSIRPPGPAQPEQEVKAVGHAFRRDWAVRVVVQNVQPAKHQLDLVTQLPLGITVYNHIGCAAIDPRHTRVSFG